MQRSTVAAQGAADGAFLFTEPERRKSVKHKKCNSNEGLTLRKPKEILREKLGRFYNE